MIRRRLTYLVRKSLLVGVILFLFLPLIQEFFYLADLKPLGGVIEYIPKPVFTREGWLNGEFQENKEKYVNQNFGFRNFLVRMNNQLDYWFHNKANAKGIIFGKEGVLHDRLYTDAYFGMNYVGDSRVDSISAMLKEIQDTLQKQNKTLIMMFAAGKATFYSELIDDEFVVEKKKNNYEGFSESMKRHGINVLDFNKWFLENKAESRYPLFPQLGIHWSIYGTSLVFDSLVKYVEKKRGIDMPEYVVNSYDLPDTLRTPDDDIYRGINLLYDLPYYKMAYPVFEIKNDGTKVQPTILTVGDSFWWNIYNTGVTKTVFSGERFWYYNNLVYPESFTQPLRADEVDFNKIIEGTDVIILCYTESTLQTIGNGFIEKLYTYCTDKSKTARPAAPNPNRERDIANWTTYIKGNKEWMQRINEKAKKTKQSVEELIKLDATWQADHPQ